MPSGPTTRPSTFAGPGWPEFAFDLTAVALGIAGLIGARYFVVLLLLGGAFAGLVGIDAYQHREPDPVERGPRVCQESSGGDNRCPGG